MSPPNAPGALEQGGSDSPPSAQPDIVSARARALVGQPFGVGSRPAGYLMIETFEAENFRCFESLRLVGLKRMNVITGANSSGKSALLEALLCATRANAEAFLTTNTLRNLHASNVASLGLFPGTVPGLAGIPPQTFRALWEHLFYAAAKNGASRVADKIDLRYSDSDAKKYSIEIAFMDTAQQSLLPEPSVIARGASGAPATTLTPLRVTRSVSAAGQPVQRSQSLISLNAQGQLMGTSPLPVLGPSLFIFSSVIDYAEVDNVTWFSLLRERGEHIEFIAFIREQFPFIENIEVLAPYGAGGLFASLKSGGVRRLQLISSGINKIITILLACANAPNGIIVVDEIENGIFYEKYEFMWSILYRYAQKFNCQLFVTSHSAECLQQLPPVIGDNAGDFSLIQTERQNGKCIARHVSGRAMKAALKGENEVRGTAGGASRAHA
jgi:AAA domain, putative AbiEii toxin, Type IV TA system